MRVRRARARACARYGARTSTVRLVPPMKAFLLASSAASRLNFLGLDSTMRRPVVKEGKARFFFPSVWTARF